MTVDYKWFATNGICQCDACRGVIVHRSDCAVHNEPALLNAACDCGASKRAAEVLGVVADNTQQVHAASEQHQQQ